MSNRTDLRLKDRIAVVTGSSSGLGRAIAQAFAASGAHVVCADLQPNSLPSPPPAQAPGAEKQEGGAWKDGKESVLPTHELLQQAHGSAAATFVHCDVTREEDVAELIKQAVEFGGSGRLDIMVNNAGISLEAAGEALRLHETPLASFDRTVAVNLRGVWLGCKYALKQFLEQQEPLSEENYRGDRSRGCILNTASVMGLVATGTAPNYVATKHAVVGLTRSIAIDYATDRIRCNALCPGFVRTNMINGMLSGGGGEVEAGIKGLHPWGELGVPEDIARAAVFLASEDSAWVTGHPLVVDGGYVASLTGLSQGFEYRTTPEDGK